MTRAGNGYSVTPLAAAVREHHPQSSLTELAALERLTKTLATQHSLPSDPVGAQMLARMAMDPATVAAALAAPLLTQHPASRKKVFELVTVETQQLIDSVLQLASVHWQSIEEAKAETLRRMFIAMAKDLRAVLALLALRVEQMRAERIKLESGGFATKPADDSLLSLARETTDVYAPLANRLGIWEFKWELENGSLAVLDPKGYLKLLGLLSETEETRDAFISRVTHDLTQHIASTKLAVDISGRSKHLFSIYKKMQRKEVNFDQVYDVSAVRLLTTSVADCYALLGLVHSLWVPLPGEFDDYIAMPKDNGYQSLHTVVMGPEGRPVEVQIRTHQMHELAEHGVAAHWAYKEQRKAAGSSRGKFLLLRKVLSWGHTEKNETDQQLSTALTTDLFEDQVYVFTPQGDVLDLPHGATPLDFAYRVHSGVGHRCRGALVNDQIAPLDYQLKNGDRVRILTNKEEAPRQDWINPAFGFLKTASARAKVRLWFKQQGRQSAIKLGREQVTRELSRLQLNHTTLDQLVAVLKYSTEEDLFAAVGHGDKRASAVANAALELERAALPPESEPNAPDETIPRSTRGIMMEDIENIAGQRAGCCKAMPGDDVIGFITRGRGVVIHKRSCIHAQESTEPERWVELSWTSHKGH